MFKTKTSTTLQTLHFFIFLDETSSMYLNMVLPNSPIFTQVAKLQSSPPKHKAKYKSYAQALTATKMSLMHNHILPPHSDDSSILNIWKIAFSERLEQKTLIYLIFRRVKKTILINKACYCSRNNILMSMLVFH